MRKNLAKHAAKKLPLAKRVLALCFALIFVCSCLLPAFANGAGTDFTDLTEDTSTVVEESVDTVEDTAPAEDLSVSEDLTADDGVATLEDGFGVDTMDESFGVDDGVAALDDDYAVDDGASTLDDDPISQPVGGIDLPIAVDPAPVVDSDDTPKEGAVNVTTDKDGNIVYEYDTSDVTFDDDFVVSQPDGDHALDKVDAAFAIPTNTYRFWLSEKDSYDLAEIASDAAAADLTEDEYLSLHGESKGLFHMMYVADGANLADYKFTSPTSVDDPSGNSRTFAGWYTIDDLGDKHDFKFDDYLYTSKSKTVDVYAKWKEEPKTVKADAELNALDVTVQVDGLIGVESLKVNQLDEYDEADLADAIENKLDTEKNIDLYTFELKPVDKNGDEVEPESGKKATVTIKGFDILSTDTIKVFHKTNLEVEDLSNTAKLDADGNLTFKTESFSPFAVVVERAKTEEEKALEKYKKWYQELKDCEPSEYEALAEIYFADEGFVEYVNNLTKDLPKDAAESADSISLFAATDKDTGYRLYIYTMIPGMAEGDSTDLNKVWNGMGVGTIYGVKSPEQYVNRTVLNTSDTDIKNLITQNKIKLSNFPTIKYKTIDGTVYTCYPDGGSQTPEVLQKNETVYTVDWIRVIRSAGANAGGNGGINPTVSETVPTYHLDGRLKFSIENYCNVDFKLKDVGEDNFTIIGEETYSKIVKKGYRASNLKVPTKEEPLVYPQTKTVNGITYRFDGWYRDEDCKDKVDFQTFIINQDEIFYGRYIPFTQNITITKQVTGLFGDKDREFNFSVNLSPAATDVTATKKFREGNTEDVTNLNSFTLRHNDSITLYNVPVGTVITITESGASDYEVTATGATGDEQTGDSASFTYTVVANGAGTQSLEDGESDIALLSATEEVVPSNSITITNHFDAPVDNGVLLDTLPYLVILAVVVGGAVLLIARKHKHDDE